MNNTDLSIIIVTYNSEKYIRNCLKNLEHTAQFRDIEIIVVDNNSRDKTLDSIRDYSSKIKILQTEKNKGYGAACNYGFSHSKGSFIIFMNPDSFPETDAIGRLLEYMQNNDKAAVASCKLLNPDMTIQPSCRTFPTLKNISMRALEWLLFLPYGKITSNYLMLEFDHLSTRKVDWVTGAFFMTRREIFKKIGGFDEKYFLYCEDTDLCLRLNAEKYDIIYAPETGNVIHHHQRLSRKFHISCEAIIHINSLLIFLSKKSKYKKLSSLTIPTPLRP